MKRSIIFFACSVFSALYGLSQWRSADPELRYDEVCFLVSHNSYAATDHGYFYAQQQWGIKKQLEAGVRGLMLDIHEDSAHNIILCHRNAFITKFICRGALPCLFMMH